MNSQLTVKDHNDERNTHGTSDEQKALKRAESMDIEKSQSQSAKISTDAQIKPCDGPQDHCRPPVQEFPSMQNIYTDDSVNNMDLETNGQNNFLACRESLF